MGKELELKIMMMDKAIHKFGFENIHTILLCEMCENPEVEFKEVLNYFFEFIVD